MILGIDTTTDWSSIALNEKCVVWCGNQNQSMELLVRIEKLMREKKVGFDDLKGVVVVNGPGSYTGTRIGVSVANTIGMLQCIPVKSVDGLVAQVVSKEITNYKAQIPNKNIISLMSAGGRRVYGRKYQVSSGNDQSISKKCKAKSKKEKFENLEGKLINNPGNFFVGEVEEFLGKENKDNYIIGEVNYEVENWIKSSGFSHFELLNDKDKLGRAGGAVRMWNDLPKVKNNNVIPSYLREAVASKK